ncbi:ABC transporter permease [Rhizobium laguerreae]|uniref:ABC transporter permease n=1 Tax=Rhizobium laguerreae TaxID=1076926 RepID=UPI001C91F980|nr:ABC transporter permease [Rhizobium laguerreae]MBY3381830.1 ABC transporter permease [Rhizobium laguerreae]
MMQRFSKSERLGVLLAGPATIYLLVFFVAPTLLLFVYSFWSSRAFVVIPDFTLVNYVGTLSKISFFASVWTGLKIGFWTAVLSVIGSFPIAYFIAYRARGNVLLYLVLISWFSSYLVRLYAWRTILGSNGLINSTLLSLGLIDHPLEFLLFSTPAVVITLVHVFLPFTLLLLLSALRNIGPDLLYAARDLGATKNQVLTKVILPMASKGVIGSFMFTYILAMGDYIAPQMLGGRESVTTGLLISNQFRATGNWPLGAAMAFILLVLFVTIYFVTVRVFRMLHLTSGIRKH